MQITIEKNSTCLWIVYSCDETEVEEGAHSLGKGLDAFDEWLSLATRSNVTFLHKKN
jgi:hypothetical protein